MTVRTIDEPLGECLETELALDRLEAELAGELPAHVRAFARAHRRGTPSPAAPAVARRASSFAVAWRALCQPMLAARALALVRLLAPIVVDDDPAVVRARAADPTWQAWRALTAARDAAAQARCGGRGWFQLVHWLHGSSAGSPGIQGAGQAAIPSPIEGWRARDELLAPAAIAQVWSELATRHGVRGTPTILVGAEGVRPRAFIVEPGMAVSVVVARTIDTPQARFEALHELGHAVAGSLVRGGLPRVIDEAAAAYIARLLETPGELAAPWFSPLAAAARIRRSVLAGVLDAIERAPGETWPTERPPWALWHDPGAQAAYVAAERLAERWWSQLGPSPGPGAFAAALTAERAVIDRATVL